MLAAFSHSDDDKIVRFRRLGMAASQEYFVAVDGDRKQITKLGAVKVRVGGTQTLFSPWKGDSLAEFAQRIQTAVDAGTKVSCARASRRLLSRLLTSSHVCSRVSCAGGTEDATGARCPGQFWHGELSTNAKCTAQA